MAVTSMRSSSIENYNKSNKMAGEVLYPDMTGGTEATFTEGNATYKSHTFTSSTTATVSRAGYVDILLVGGGGGASEGGNTSQMGGGGGGGGVLYRENVYLVAGSWTVTIGAGSAAAQWSGNAGQGDATLFYPAANPELGWGALGGGGGARTNSQGGFGASGGGSGDNQPNNSAFFATQGHQGGAGIAPGNSAGGGGGAGEDGTDATGGTGRGAGGDGRIINIIPTATATSQSVGEVSGSDVYFGGGGGGGVASSPVADGGLGGGAIGATGNQTAPSGDPNTGGGGGGAESTGGNPGAGGSGVLIVRYRTS